MKKVFVAGLMSFFVYTNFAFAVGEDKVVKTKSKIKNAEITLTFPGEKITEGTLGFTVCAKPFMKLTKAVLIMKHGQHQHGTTPTSVSEVTEENCQFVDDVNFTMPGTWEIHLKFQLQEKSSIDTAVAQIVVEKTP